MIERRLAALVLVAAAWVAAPAPSAAQAEKPAPRQTPGFAVNALDQSVNACTDFYQFSCGRYRVNGVVSNMPEFQKAFSCPAGSPMVRENACRVW